MFQVSAALIKIASTIMMAMFMSSARGVAGRKCCITVCYMQIAASALLIPVGPIT